MITCFRCGQHGHYASECDATTEEVEQYHRGQTQTMKHGAGEQLDRIPVKKEPCLTLTLMDERQDTKP